MWKISEYLPASVREEYLLDLESKAHAVAFTSECADCILASVAVDDAGEIFLALPEP